MKMRIILALGQSEYDQNTNRESSSTGDQAVQAPAGYFFVKNEKKDWSAALASVELGNQCTVGAIYVVLVRAN